MNIATNPDEKILGVPVGGIPERCRSCPRLAHFALIAPNLNLEAQASYPHLSNQANHVARLVFSRMGSSCPNGVDEAGNCGSVV